MIGELAGAAGAALHFPLSFCRERREPDVAPPSTSTVFSRARNRASFRCRRPLPRLAKISLLWDPATGFRQLRAIEEVAGVMKLEVSIVEVRAPAELDAAMAAASRNGPDALVMLSSPIIGGSYQALANFTL